MTFRSRPRDRDERRFPRDELFPSVSSPPFCCRIRPKIFILPGDVLLGDSSFSVNDSVTAVSVNEGSPTGDCESTFLTTVLTRFFTGGFLAALGENNFKPGHFLLLFSDPMIVSTLSSFAGDAIANNLSNTGCDDEIGAIRATYEVG